MRVAVSGAGGRLGRALIGAFEEASFVGPAGPVAWSRPEFDLDHPEGFAALLDRDRPEIVVHAAAWTDVDGCARDPGLALARNGEATAAVAESCAARGLDLVVVSTNEVFDGGRTDGRGYSADEPTAPANSYGASKLAAERAAIEAYADIRVPALAGFRGSAAPPAHPQLAIVRTAWLFGPPGGDFPDRIAAAAGRAAEQGEPLRVVGDEIGTPTSAADLADAIAELLGGGAFHGIHHLVNGGMASRATWAQAVLAAFDVAVPVVEIGQADYPRPSTPPAWGVLEPTPLPSGEPMPDWPDALARDLPWRLRARAAAGVR